ncbi:MAG TPA: drug/metabolite exporter YedA [Kofleriaceae bacterium]|nr:drug/metabolite exporter YedA [Kofleriaceae bacterium]
MKSKLLVCLAAVYVIWGSTYLAMRICVVELPPLMMAGVRFALAGGTLLALALRSGAKLPPRRDWLRMLPIGALLFLGGNGFIAIAEQSVSSGGAAVVAAMMPLWVGVLGRLFGTRATAREWLSLVIGFVGVVVLMGGPSLAGEPIHVVLLVFGPIAWALGSLLSRRTQDIGGSHGALVRPAMQMLLGSAVLLAVALVKGEHWPAHASREAYLSLAYLYLFGSVIGFTAYAWLLAHARPVVATSYAYVNPILAVLLGSALKGEALGWTTVVANVLIVTAVMLALRPPSGSPRAPRSGVTTDV